jgi:hypothetical protein
MYMNVQLKFTISFYNLSHSSVVLLISSLNFTIKVLASRKGQTNNIAVHKVA